MSCLCLERAFQCWLARDALLIDQPFLELSESGLNARFFEGLRFFGALMRRRLVRRAPGRYATCRYSLEVLSVSHCQSGLSSVDLSK